jgi:formate dehydrogenase major subunit
MATKDSDTKSNKRGLSRRDFLKASAAAGAVVATDWVLVGPKPAQALPAPVTNEYDKTSVCQYCSVGCGLRVGTDAQGNIVDIIGDPDHPVSKGRLCSKGASLIQVVNNPRRLGVPDSLVEASRSDGADDLGPMVRVGNNDWESITWNEAFYGKASHSDPKIQKGIAQLMVEARDGAGNPLGAGIPMSGGKVTGTAKNLAMFGCSYTTNESNWLIRKLVANLGTNNIETQARL